MKAKRIHTGVFSSCLTRLSALPEAWSSVELILGIWQLNLRPCLSFMPRSFPPSVCSSLLTARVMSRATTYLGSVTSVEKLGKVSAQQNTSISALPYTPQWTAQRAPLSAWKGLDPPATMSTACRIVAASHQILILIEINKHAPVMKRRTVPICQYLISWRKAACARVRCRKLSSSKAFRVAKFSKCWP